MPNSTFLPRTDLALREWSENCAAKIVLSPELYGLSATEAANLAALSASYSDAMDALADPDLRTRAAVARKNSIRAQLRRAASSASQRIQGTVSVTNAQKISLGLTVPAASPTPATPPAVEPVVQIVAVNERTIHFRLQDKLNPSSRRKPDGVVGATLCCFVSEEPPPPDTKWNFERVVGRMRDLHITLPAHHPPRTRVWISATWFNGSKQPSPRSTPVSTRLQYSLAG